MYRIAFLWMLSWSVQAQLPITHIYSFEWSDDSTVVYNATLLSGYNLNGYNNQPHFLRKDELAFTMSWHIDATTDIYAMDLLAKTVQPITETSDAEYSPQLVNDHWYCVKVDSQKNQWLWTSPRDGSHAGNPVLMNQDKIGYYSFINSDSIVAFLTGPPHQLVTIDIQTEEKYNFTSNIGRTFQIFDDHIYYVHKLTDASWYIKKYDRFLRRSTIITTTLEGAEDFHILPNGKLLMAKGSAIYSYDLAKDGTWVEFLDLSEFGLSNITRMTSNEKYLVCVDKK